jgi:hypothetical protein
LKRKEELVETGDKGKKKIWEGLCLNRANELKMNKADNFKLGTTGRKK